MDGSIAPVDTSSSAKPINFRVVLPASWGGPGSTERSPLERGLATYGSDSGHQLVFPAGARQRRASTSRTGDP
jgi:hypothetical protein